MKHRNKVIQRWQQAGSEIKVRGEELSYFVPKLGKKMLPTTLREIAQINQ